MGNHKRKFNHGMQTVGSARYPLGVGDRYYDVDIVRDNRYLQSIAGRMIEKMYGTASLLVMGGTCSKGSDWTKMNILAAAGICSYDAEVPDDSVAWAVPAAITTAQLKVLVECPNITDLSLSTATLNGSAVNYVKLRYKEQGLLTRSRVYAAGTWAYAAEDSYEIIVNTVAPTDYDVVLCSFVGNGTSTMVITQRAPFETSATPGSPNVLTPAITDNSTKTATTAFVKSAIAHVSDSDRVFHLTGDGIPTFPDNVAGRTYWQDDWATTDEWGAFKSTLSVANGTLIATLTDLNGTASKSISASSGKLITLIVKSSYAGDIQLKGTINGVSDILLASVTVTAGAYTRISTVLSGALTYLYVMHTTAPAGNTITIDAVYIGSDLYDTPVYDKACCNRFTNNGVLPVPGQRGLAMSFNGNAYLQADNPVIGTTGTIAFKFKRGTIGSVQTIFDNRDNSNRNGIGLVIDVNNDILFAVRDNTTVSFVVLGNVTDTINIHSLIVSWDNTTIKSYLDTVFSSRAQLAIGTPSTTPLRIGATTTGVNIYSGLLADLRYDSRIWTQDDVTRYHNGDDPVDSQQKSVTAVPHSIMTRRSDGRTEVGPGTAPKDAVNVSQVRILLTGNVVKTVGSGGDFATLNAAKAWLVTVTPGDNATLELRLVSGFVMAESWIQIGCDYGWVRITSVSAEVSITRSALSSGVAFLVQKAGVLPRIEALFNMDSSAGSNTSGIRVLDGSRAIIGYGAGIKNVGRAGVDIAGVGIYVGALGQVIAGGSIFSASTGTGIWMQAGGTLYAESINISGCHTAANIEGSTAYLQSANASGNTANGIIANHGAKVVIEGANTKRDATERTLDIQVVNGSIISAVGASGGVSQTANTITVNGIIFK